MLVEEVNTGFTPISSSGFSARLVTLLDVAHIHRRGYMAFIAEATGLSKSTSRRIVEKGPPPKRYAVFLKLTHHLAKVISMFNNKPVDAKSIENYLLHGYEIPQIPVTSAHSIAAYIDQDPLLTSQIILKITGAADKLGIDMQEDISEKHIQLINFRVVSYCFKNGSDVESEKVKGMIVGLLELAKQQLLL